MNGVQLCQGYRATTRRHFTFYHSVPSNSWYSAGQPGKDERLSWPWGDQVVLNPGPLDLESSNLTTSPCQITLTSISYKLFYVFPCTSCPISYYRNFNFFLVFLIATCSYSWRFFCKYYFALMLCFCNFCVCLFYIFEKSYIYWSRNIALTGFALALFTK